MFAFSSFLPKPESGWYVVYCIDKGLWLQNQRPSNVDDKVDHQPDDSCDIDVGMEEISAGKTDNKGRHRHDSDMEKVFQLGCPFIADIFGYQPNVHGVAEVIEDNHSYKKSFHAVSQQTDDDGTRTDTTFHQGPVEHLLALAYGGKSENSSMKLNNADIIIDLKSDGGVASMITKDNSEMKYSRCKMIINGEEQSVDF